MELDAAAAEPLDVAVPVAVPDPVLPATAAVPVFFAVVPVVVPVGSVTATPVLEQTPIENAEGPVGAVNPEVREASAAECSFDQLTKADS